MKTSPGSCLGCRWARTREGDWVSSRSVIDVGVIIRHLVENFVHALKKEIPSAFLRATGKRLRIEAATSMRFITAERAAPARPRLHLALCQFFGARVTLSSGTGFQAEQILLMLFLESRSQRQLRKKMT